jgi:ParB-like chromosome segregation protein Spo0J
MNIEKVSIDKLKAAAYNPRKTLKPGDAEYEKLKRSITEFGYVEPVIWNRTTGNVVGGHQRLTILKDLGQSEVDCVIVELDEKREKALNVALNKIQGEWDKDKLAELLTELDGSEFDVTLTGFDAAEIDELLNAFYSKEAVQDDFDVDEEHDKIKAKGAVSKPGDIWKLGVHRLMCGDSTSEVDFAKLMNGSKAQMTVT